MANIDTFIEDCELALAKRLGLKIETGPVVCPGFPCEGQLWHSKTSGRRGRVQWASQGKVRLVFDDGSAGVEHCTLDFLRLYSECK
jgi:hypothetical protein